MCRDDMVEEELLIKVINLRIEQVILPIHCHCLARRERTLDSIDLCRGIAPVQVSVSPIESDF